MKFRSNLVVRYLSRLVEKTSIPNKSFTTFPFKWIIQSQLNLCSSERYPTKMLFKLLILLQYINNFFKTIKLFKNLNIKHKLDSLHYSY